MFIYTDENHKYHNNLAEMITKIVFNREFIQLRNELEVLYKKLSFAEPKEQAFQDALYSFLSQDDGLIPAKAL